MRYLITFLRCLPALALVLAPSGVAATNVSGRLTTSFYSWERQDTDSTSTAHGSFYQLLSLNAGKLGVDGLSFHAYGRGFTHLEGSDHARELALYNLYGDWNGLADRLDLRFGRQYIYAGVGRGALDGLRGVLRLSHSMEVLAYAGSQTPADGSTSVDGWADARMYGARANYRKWNSLFSVSFTSRSRRRESSSLNNDDGNPVELPTLARRLIGAEVRTRRLGRADLYGRVDLDAVYWEPSRIQVVARGIECHALRLSAEVDYRQPVVDANSFLSVFHHEANTELGGTATYPLHSGVTLTSAYAVVLYEDDEAQRFRLGVSRGPAFVSYYRRLGYGGDRDGLSLGTERAVTPKFKLRGSFGYSRYTLYDLQNKRDDTLTGVVGLDYTVNKRLAANIEGQVLRNTLYDYDLRFFAKATWWFSLTR